MPRFWWIPVAAACLSTATAEAASSPFDFANNAAAKLLAAHNGERSRMRLPGLRWDPALAASAASYGRTLARLGALRHSPRSSRPGQHENLWMGTRGAFSPEQMVGSWLSERVFYRAAATRRVNWFDYGHYAQIIAAGTTRVGCAIHKSAHWDFLICRYGKDGARPAVMASNLRSR